MKAKDIKRVLCAILLVALAAAFPSGALAGTVGERAADLTHAARGVFYIESNIYVWGDYG